MKRQSWFTIKNFLCGTILLSYLLSIIMTETSPTTKIIDAEIPVESYKIEDPTTAFYVLEQLDIFNQIDISERELAEKYKGQDLLFKVDNNYCSKHRNFFINHPEAIFNQQNIFVTNTSTDLLTTSVVPEIGTPLIIAPSETLGNDQQSYNELSLNMTSLFTFRRVHKRAAIGIHYSCLSQTSSAIPGAERLARKSDMADAVRQYAGGFKTRPYCFSNTKFFPETWALYDTEQCKEFFKIFNSERYVELKKERGDIVYIRKIGSGVHGGSGVFPFDKKEENYVRDLYANGGKCGKIQENNLMQYFIYNPLLLNGHKCDFRTYMLIASTNPIIAYYNNGFLRVSLNNYDTGSNEQSVLITNTGVAQTLFKIAAKNGTYQGRNISDLVHSHLWTQERLQEYLLEKGLVKDSNWLENYLRPEIRRAMAHLVMMTQDRFLKKSSIYEIFGVDFMLDNDLNLWFIEANKAPGLGYKDDPEDIVQEDIRMLKDHFEIVYGLMRSRMKRVVRFVNILIKSGYVEKLSSTQIFIKDLEKVREEFETISRNNFEPEYEPSPMNSWQPVINENYEGTARYSGLFDEKCV